MASSFIRNMLGRQHKRAISMVLGHAERAFYDRLSESEREEFRGLVLSVLSSYHQACVDMVESSVNDGMMINEEALRVMADFTESTQRYRDELRGLSAPPVASGG